MREKSQSIRLCEEQPLLLANLKWIQNRDNFLFCGRLFHLITAFPPKMDASLRYYLLTDQKGRIGILAFRGNLGLFACERRFSRKFAAHAAMLLTTEGDLITTDEKSGKKLFWFAEQGLFSKASGDSFVLPAKILLRHTPFDKPGEFSFAPPEQKAIRDYFDLFRAGFSGFAGRTFDSFYAEQSHLLRHQNSALCGIYEGSLLLSGCAVDESEEMRYLYDLTTKESHRGRDLAARLLFWVAKSDNRPLYLCAQDENLSAWYRHLGFETCGRWMQLYRR